MLPELANLDLCDDLYSGWGPRHLARLHRILRFSIRQEVQYSRPWYKTTIFSPLVLRSWKIIHNHACTQTSTPFAMPPIWHLWALNIQLSVWKCHKLPPTHKHEAVVSDVLGDGRCGYRAIAKYLGTSWKKVTSRLLRAMEENPQENVVCDMLHVLVYPEEINLAVDQNIWVTFLGWQNYPGLRSLFCWLALG